MAWKRKNRWFRRWLLVSVFWLVPIMIVAGREVQDEMAYNRADLQRALTTWTFTDAAQPAAAARHCRGTLDAARAAGCPASVIAANAARQQEARDEYALRRATLAAYLWHAFEGYWIAPVMLLLAIGMAIGGVRRMLRRPSASVEPHPVPRH